MTPHLRKRCSSSTMDIQEEVRSIGKATASKVNRATNKTSRHRDRVKSDTRMLTRARKVIAVKGDRSSSQNAGKEKKRTSRKKLVEQNVSDQVESEKSSGTKMKKKEPNNKRKVITRTSTKSRQISLKESFLNQSKKAALRPRSKHVDDASTKKVSDNGKKLPIYDRVSPEKSQNERSSEIYEFKFDVNDSKERVRRKVKKRTIVKRRAVNKNRKNVSVKRNIVAPKANTKKAAITDELETAEKADPVDSVKQENKEIESKEDSNDIMPVADVELNKGSEKLDDAVTRKIMDIEKSTISSVEHVNNESAMALDNSEPSKPDGFKPFGPTNIFSNRLMVSQRNVLHCSLLDKSLSPIKRPTDNAQMHNNSPWRISPVPKFSQVRNMYQSTPQNNVNGVHRIFLRPLSNDPRQFGNVLRDRSNLQKSNEIVISNTPKKKTSLISRKFGTEITNVDHSLQSKSPIEINGRTSVKSNEDIENLIGSNANALKPVDKKNNVLSPRNRSPLKKSNVMVVKVDVHVADQQKENVDPLPGSSGLQSTTIPNEQHILRQSNLNNFLSITETPQSATIRTPHGIFDDPEPISIVGKSLNRTDKSNVELKTAFGFDDDSTPEYATLNDIPAPFNCKSLNEKPVTRLSVNEIKNVLLKKNETGNEHNSENVVVKKNVMKSAVQRKIDPVSFSDTFDVLSEAGETTAASITEVPLFADCEPTHFKEPPRHSYKRKQVSQLDFSEQESENEDTKEILHRRKRKKNNKPNNEANKRLMKWINDINRTFHEIDEHELVVE